MTRIGAFVVALALLTGSVNTGGTEQASGGLLAPTYQGLIDSERQEYFYRALEVAALSPAAAVAATPYVAIFETNRVNILTQLAIHDQVIKDTLAIALTTNTVRDYRIAAEADVQGARHVLGKLKKDLRFFEDKYPGFAAAGDNFIPRRGAQATDWNNYSEIRKALKSFTYDRDNLQTGARETVTLTDAETTLERHMAHLREGLSILITRLNQVATYDKDGRPVVVKSYPLSALRSDSGFLKDRVAPLADTVFGIHVMAEQLFGLGKTPKNQLRAEFANTSRDMMFFIQVESRKPDGTYTLRPDTVYPIPLYPDVAGLSEAEKAQLQIEPRTRPGSNRGRTWAYLPLNPRDRVVIRVATMGQVRDRIRFMVARGQTVSQDLNSVSRGFYYYGYQSDTPGGTLISQWYPVDESYTWQFRGEWAGTRDAAKIQGVQSTTDTRGLGAFGFTPLQLHNDRFFWLVPESMQIAASLEEATADVTGTGAFHKRGPRVSVGQPQVLTEQATGRVSMLVQAW